MRACKPAISGRQPIWTWRRESNNDESMKTCEAVAAPLGDHDGCLSRSDMITSTPTSGSAERRRIRTLAEVQPDTDSFCASICTGNSGSIHGEPNQIIILKICHPRRPLRRPPELYRRVGLLTSEFDKFVARLIGWPPSVELEVIACSTPGDNASFPSV